MRKVIMTISEFLNFRILAEQRRVKFTYGIAKGQATVQADASFLEELGY